MVSGGASGTDPWGEGQAALGRPLHLQVVLEVGARVHLAHLQHAGPRDVRVRLGRS